MPRPPKPHLSYKVAKIMLDLAQRDLNWVIRNFESMTSIKRGRITGISDQMLQIEEEIIAVAQTRMDWYAKMVRWYEKYDPKFKRRPV